jgi:hypothetical protein
MDGLLNALDPLIQRYGVPLRVTGVNGEVTQTKVGILAWADDLALISNTREGMEALLRGVTEFLGINAVALNAGKSFYTSIGANRRIEPEPPLDLTLIGARIWQPDGITEEDRTGRTTRRAIHGETGALEWNPPDTAFKYLGVYLTLTRNWSHQRKVLEGIVDDHCSHLRNKTVTFEEAAKIVRTSLLPKLRYVAQIITPDMAQIRKWDQKIGGMLREKAGGSAKGVNADTFYASVKNRGWGAPSLRLDYIKTMITETCVRLEKWNQSRHRPQPDWDGMSAILQKQTMGSEWGTKGDWIWAMGRSVERRTGKRGKKELLFAEGLAQCLKEVGGSLASKRSTRDLSVTQLRENGIPIILCSEKWLEEDGSEAAKAGIKFLHHIMTADGTNLLPWEVLAKIYGVDKKRVAPWWEEVRGRICKGTSRSVARDWLFPNAKWERRNGGELQMNRGTKVDARPGAMLVVDAKRYQDHKEFPEIKSVLFSLEDTAVMRMWDDTTEEPRDFVSVTWYMPTNEEGGQVYSQTAGRYERTRKTTWEEIGGEYPLHILDPTTVDRRERVARKEGVCRRRDLSMEEQEDEENTLRELGLLRRGARVVEADREWSLHEEEGWDANSRPPKDTFLGMCVVDWHEGDDETGTRKPEWSGVLGEARWYKDRRSGNWRWEGRVIQEADGGETITSTRNKEVWYRERNLSERNDKNRRTEGCEDCERDPAAHDNLWRKLRRKEAARNPGEFGETKEGRERWVGREEEPAMLHFQCARIPIETQRNDTDVQTGEVGGGGTDSVFL